MSGTLRVGESSALRIVCSWRPMLLETVDESTNSQHWQIKEQVAKSTHVCSERWTSYQNHELRGTQIAV